MSLSNRPSNKEVSDQNSKDKQRTRYPDGKSIYIRLSTHKRLVKVQSKYYEEYNNKPEFSDLIEKGLDMITEKLSP